MTNGKLHKFKHVFESNLEQLKMFRRFNRLRTTQIITNYTAMGITAGAITYGFYQSTQPRSGQSAELDVIIAILGAAAIGPIIMLISNPIFQIVKKKKK